MSVAVIFFFSGSRWVAKSSQKRVNKNNHQSPQLIRNLGRNLSGHGSLLRVSSLSLYNIFTKRNAETKGIVLTMRTSAAVYLEESRTGSGLGASWIEIGKEKEKENKLTELEQISDTGFFEKEKAENTR